MTVALPSYRIRFVHLTAVWAYGVSQPVFALIDGNPDLLLSRDATRVVRGALRGPPGRRPTGALHTAYAWLAGRYSPWIGDRVYLFALGACLVPLAARAVKQVDPTLVLALGLLAALVVAGVVVVRALAGRAYVRRLLGGASGARLRLVRPRTADADGSAEAAAVRVTSPAPVVFIVLDEMAASSLMTRDGAIDAVRYPNFARLATRGDVVSECDDGARVDGRRGAVDVQRKDRRRARRSAPREPSRQPLHASRWRVFAPRPREHHSVVSGEALPAAADVDASPPATGSSRTASSCSSPRVFPSRCPGT